MKTVTLKDNPIINSPALFDGTTQLLLQVNEFLAPLEIRLTRVQVEELVREIFYKTPHTERLLAEITGIVKGRHI